MPKTPSELDHGHDDAEYDFGADADEEGGVIKTLEFCGLWRGWTKVLGYCRKHWIAPLSNTLVLCIVHHPLHKIL